MPDPGERVGRAVGILQLPAELLEIIVEDLISSLPTGTILRSSAKEIALVSKAWHRLLLRTLWHKTVLLPLKGDAASEEADRWNHFASEEFASQASHIGLLSIDEKVLKNCTPAVFLTFLSKCTNVIHFEVVDERAGHWDEYCTYIACLRVVPPLCTGFRYASTKYKKYERTCDSRNKSSCFAFDNLIPQRPLLDALVKPLEKLQSVHLLHRMNEEPCQFYDSILTDPATGASNCPALQTLRLTMPAPAMLGNMAEWGIPDKHAIIAFREKHKGLKHLELDLLYECCSECTLGEVSDWEALAESDLVYLKQLNAELDVTVHASYRTDEQLYGFYYHGFVFESQEDCIGVTLVFQDDDDPFPDDDYDTDEQMEIADYEYIFHDRSDIFLRDRAAQDITRPLESGFDRIEGHVEADGNDADSSVLEDDSMNEDVSSGIESSDADYEETGDDESDLTDSDEGDESFEDV